MKSPASLPAKIMTELGLNKIVYFIVKDGTEDQRAYLHELIGSSVEACLPLRSQRHPRRRHQLWIVSARPSIGDVDLIASYNDVLRHVFGEHCRITVRICRRVAL